MGNSINTELKLIPHVDMKKVEADLKHWQFMLQKVKAGYDVGTPQPSIKTQITKLTKKQITGKIGEKEQVTAERVTRGKAEYKAMMKQWNLMKSGRANLNAEMQQAQDAAEAKRMNNYLRDAKQFRARAKHELQLIEKDRKAHDKDLVDSRKKIHSQDAAAKIAEDKRILTNALAARRAYDKKEREIEKARIQKTKDDATAKIAEDKRVLTNALAARRAYDKKERASEKARLKTAKEAADKKIRDDKRVLDAALAARREYDRIVRRSGKTAIKESRDAVKAREDYTRAEAKKTSNVIRESFQTAFSMHILRMYAAPFLRGLNTLVKSTLDNFAEFDKSYADYIAKSGDFAQTLSRTDVFRMASGQAFAVNDVADAMERFSASGIDVTQNQDAVTDVLKVATAAQVDYKEAANSVIKTMEAFNLSMGESTRIVDVMTNAANASTAELKDIIKWFQYTSGAAQVSGLSIEQLAATLGVLSSTGLPNVGTAFRQFLLQFQKVDVREKFAEKFGFTDVDFRDMGYVMDVMREYVKTSSDQTAATEELTQMLGGKANALLALTNILGAQDDLWDRLNTVVYDAGTTSELYAQATDNAAHSMERIKNAFTLLSAQIGQVFLPILKTVEFVMVKFTDILTNLPTPLRWVLGGLLLIGMAAGVVITGVLTLLTGLALLQGLTASLAAKQITLSLSMTDAAMSVKMFVWVLQGLNLEQARTAAANINLSGSFMGVNNAALVTAGGIQTANRSMTAMRANAALMVGVFGGIMAASYLTENRMYKLANAMWLIVAALVAIKVASMAVLGPLGWVAGLASGAAIAGGGLYYTRGERLTSGATADTSHGGATYITHNAVTIEGINLNTDASNDIINSLSQQLPGGF